MKKLKNWIGLEGLLHIETSTLLYLFIALPIWINYGLLFSVPVGFIIVVFVGAVKELNDLYVNNKPDSNHDFLCNIIGFVIGAIFNLILSII
jgi:VanZ family protein